MDNGSVSKEFSFPFGDIVLTRERIARAMGYGSKPLGDAAEAELERVLAELPDRCVTRAGFVLLHATMVAIEDDAVRCGEQRFSIGKVIARQLAGSRELAIFLATAGKGIDQWSHEAAERGDLLKSFLIDTCGSEIAEAAADLLEDRLREMVAGDRESITNRYSPGYSGWNVSEQKKLFALLPEGFCGVSLTASSMMVPIKSVSGIIGIGEGVEKHPYGCGSCAKDDCFKRL